MPNSQEQSVQELMAFLDEHRIPYTDEDATSTTILKRLVAAYRTQAGKADAAQSVADTSNLSSPIMEQSGKALHPSEEDELDTELRLLRKRVEIARLKRMLETGDFDAVNQLNLQATDSQLTQTTSGPTFKDIKKSILQYSSSETYDAYKWISDFERTCDSVGGDDAFRFRSIKRFMKPGSEAESFLRVDTSTNYDEFRTNFLINFGHAYSIPEIIEKMKETLYKPENTVMSYVLQMQELASRAKLDEQHTIRYIIEGLRDRTANVSVLFPAKTLDEFKTLIPRYIQMRKSYAALTHRSDQRTKLTTNPTSVNQTKCFNCNGFGHISAKCPEPKRQPQSCFRCGSTQHTIRQCPKPAPKNKDGIALADDFRQLTVEPIKDPDETTDVVAEVNKVGVAFPNIRSNMRCNMFSSLFDTGSPISMIRRSLVPATLIGNTLQSSRFRGLGNNQLNVYGQTTAFVRFRHLNKPISLYVVPDHFIPYSLLLGRDFLKLCNISLSMTSDCNEFDRIRLNKNIQKVLQCVIRLSNIVKPLLSSCASSSSDSDIIKETPNQLEQLPYIFAISEELSNVSDYDISNKLNQFHQRAISDLIVNHYLNHSKIPETIHNYEMKIRLNSEIPVFSTPRRLSYADRLEVDQIVQDLIEKGHVRPSESPYASPLVLVTKKNGERRMCIDYRALNKITIRDSFPLPLIDDCLERLEGKKIFSVLDLKSGFHQIRVSSESIPYTAFVTPSGQYEYVRMPFGLRNAPAVFQRFINHVLSPFIKEGSVVVYLDDITIATANIIDHLSVLQRVLRRLAEYRLELNFKKCQFGYEEIDLLGFNISNKGIRPNDSHIENIRHLPLPENKQDVQKCLGLFSYFRRFIPGCSSIERPLRQLLKENVTFNFDESCKAAFQTLRDKLTSLPILVLYSPHRETELHCDASALGFGAILLQRQDDKRMHPVGYFSRRATEAESRYHSYELETLAIVYAIEKFRIYLDRIPFKIITDCQALALTLQNKRTNSRIARWALLLENYTYSIQHRCGALMPHVDALSRYFPDQSALDKTFANSVSDQSVTPPVIALVEPKDVDAQLLITQNRDQKILNIRETLEKEFSLQYELRDGLVFRKYNNRLLLYVPSELECNIIRVAHETICHLGVTKTMDQIRLSYWFPRMQEKVDAFIKNCLQCIMHSVPPQSRARTLHPIPKAPVPFDTIHVDHFGPLPSVCSKRKYLFVVVDAFTKFVKLYPVNTTSYKEICSSLEHYFDHYSRPRRLISDRGSCFNHLDFKQFLSDKNIEHIRVATAAPQANGQVERVNRVLKSMLSKVVEPLQHSDWVKQLSRVEYAINNSVHSVTRYTPSSLLFGVNQRGPVVDTMAEYLEGKQPAPSIDRSEQRQQAHAQIALNQEKTLAFHSTKFKPHSAFKIGDFVMIRNVDTTVGTNKKLIPKYRGPYVIHQILPNDRYVIRDIENYQVTQIPYDGILEASRIRPWADWRTDAREDPSGGSER